jgi:hypothetical protein
MESKLCVCVCRAESEEAKAHKVLVAATHLQRTGSAGSRVGRLLSRANVLCVGIRSLDPVSIRKSRQRLYPCS